MEMQKQKSMTVDEFLVWAEGRDGRYELHDGEVVKMPAERAVHRRIKGRLYIAFTEAVKSTNLPCHVETDGATVRIAPHIAYEPDAMVYCGARVDDDSLEVPNPVIIAEVLSPGNSLKDLKEKLVGYFTVASVQHYLIVDPDKKMIIHHARAEGDVLSTRLVAEGEVRLFPPGLVVRLEDVFG